MLYPLLGLAILPVDDIFGDIPITFEGQPPKHPCKHLGPRGATFYVYPFPILTKHLRQAVGLPRPSCGVSAFTGLPHA